MWQFMGDHPILTCILALMICSTAIDIASILATKKHRIVIKREDTPRGDNEDRGEGSYGRVG